MLTVRYYEEPCPLVLVDGDRPSLSRLVEAARVSGSVEVDPGEPVLPAGVPLASIGFVTVESADVVRARVAPDRGQLVVEGWAEGLSILAENIDGLVDATAGTHRHIEWFEDHFYLTEDSVPLVVARV